VIEDVKVVAVLSVVLMEKFLKHIQTNASLVAQK